MYQELVRNKITVPWDMANNLMILHSYTLARLHVRYRGHIRTRISKYYLPIPVSVRLRKKKGGKQTNFFDMCFFQACFDGRARTRAVAQRS